MTENRGRVEARGLHHYAVAVSDLDRSIEWYGQMLDFEVERRFGSLESGAEIAHLVDPNGLRIELLAQTGSAGGPDKDFDPFQAISVQGAKHIGFLVDDVDATWELLSGLGADLLSEPTVVEPAGVKNCFIRDPDGIMIEFDQWLD